METLTLGPSDLLHTSRFVAASYPEKRKRISFNDFNNEAKAAIERAYQSNCVIRYVDRDFEKIIPNPNFKPLADDLWALFESFIPIRQKIDVATKMCNILSSHDVNLRPSEIAFDLSDAILPEKIIDSEKFRATIKRRRSTTDQEIDNREREVIEGRKQFFHLNDPDEHVTWDIKEFKEFALENPLPSDNPTCAFVGYLNKTGNKRLYLPLEEISDEDFYSLPARSCLSKTGVSK